MTTYYKAVRPDGGSFHDPSIVWRVGETVTHPLSGAMRPGNASTYLSVSVVPTNCTGFQWPCRLFRVEPVGEVMTPDPEGLPNKRAAKAWRVVEELDPTLALGPQGQYVAALIERCKTLTLDGIGKLYVARYAAGYAAGDAARDTALALTARDLISTEDYDTLTLPWRKAIGRIHPDDPEVTA